MFTLTHTFLKLYSQPIKAKNSGKISGFYVQKLISNKWKAPLYVILISAGDGTSSWLKPILLATNAHTNKGNTVSTKIAQNLVQTQKKTKKRKEKKHPGC